MKSSVKRALSLMLSCIMALSMSISAFAADTSANSIKVQLDGKPIEVKYAPVSKNGRTYVDYRSVLAAMGADVSYNYQTNVLTCVVNGKTSEIKDTIITNNGPYVSLRAIADSTGCAVGWDSSTKTALLLNVDKLIAKYQGKFKIMDKYLAYSRELTSHNLAVAGTFDMSMKVTEAGETLPVTVKGKLDGLSTATLAEMNMNMAVDMTNVLKKEDLATLDAKSTALLKELGNTKMSIIMNMDTGMIYMQSKLITMMAGLADNTWISVNLDDMMKASGLNMSMSSLVAMCKSETFDAYLSGMLRAMPLTDSDAVAELTKSLDSFEGMFGDKTIVKKGSDYVSTYTQEEAGTATKMNMTFNTKDDKVVGYSMDMSTAVSGAEIMKLTAKQDASNNMTMNMTLTVPGIMEAVYDIKMQYTKTDKTPKGKPADGSKIVSAESMLGL